MKWITAILLLCQLSVYANGLAQITMSYNKAPLERVMRDVKKQSGYDFVINVQALDAAKPVSVKFTNKNLGEALNLIFKEQPLSYEINDRLITVRLSRIPKANDEKKRKEIQQNAIAGQVTDFNGKGLAGVTIRVKGTSLLTISNSFGNYIIDDVPAGSYVQFTILGYEAIEISSDNIPPIIRLRSEVSKLDEAIVIAYGSTTKRLNTGAVSKVSSAELAKQPVSNPIVMLQGRVPGLEVDQDNGLPGSNLSVTIRGRNSIQQGTAPLYLVDGIPFGSESLAQNSLIFASSPFNSINPADIESIEVLKDADATAIYGSRGANGVILITTKKAKQGRTEIDVSAYHGWGTITRAPELMNTEQYLQMRREAFKNDNVEPTLQNAYDLLAWDQTRNIDWKKKLIGNTAHTTNLQARLSGGTESTRFVWNSGYFRESTVYPGENSAKRITTGLTVSHISADKNFSTDIVANYARENSNLMRSILSSFILLPPNSPEPYDIDGNLQWKENDLPFINPMALLLERYETKTDRLTLHANPGYRIGPIKIKADLGYNYMGFDEWSAIPIASKDPADDPVGSANFGKSSSSTLIIEPQVEFKKDVGDDHHFSAIAGGTWQINNQSRNNIRASGYTNDSFLRYASGTAAPSIITTSGVDQYRYQAFFLRANYSFRNRYILNLTARRDGSSRFGPENKYANFGAIGAAWVFTDEPVFRESKLLSYGKLRASYGITGNDQIGNYQYLDTWNATIRPYLNELSMQPTRLANPYFAWESNKKLDLALEIGFFKNRLLATVDYYRNVSDNQLIYYSLPTQTGFMNILQNFPGIVENKGWEFQLVSENIKGLDFAWTTTFNLTLPENKLLEFPGLESSSYANSYEIGQSLSVVKGLKYTGVDPQTGIYTFEDKDGDGQLGNADFEVVGNLVSSSYGGLQNSFSYKGAQLDFLFQFNKKTGRHPVYGRSIPPGGIENTMEIVSDRWHNPGDNAAYQKFTQTFGDAYNAAFDMSRSDRSLTDASFIRLKNVSLSYQLPSKLLRSIRASQWRIFLQGQNLLTFSDYEGDPETGNLLSLPPLKVFAIGTQLTF